MDKNLKMKLWPILLALAVIALDQISKALIGAYIPLGTIGSQFFGDFLRIIHVSIAIVVVIYFRNQQWTKLQCWAIMGIVGGGLGNLIDRLFRKEGVVDFIDIKFYGLFGMDRWPTFNIADSAVVVCGILLIISFIVLSIREKKSNKE